MSERGPMVGGGGGGIEGATTAVGTPLLSVLGAQAVVVSVPLA